MVVSEQRGVIFHGPAGNGKTISIKGNQSKPWPTIKLTMNLALMHSLSEFKEASIPALYVKSAPRTYDIRNIFAQARYMAPCMLILEDIDTIVTPSSRSYFFNEVDGLENNDGIFMVASTNHLDQLDPGLSSRPSRFDRKYLFPIPSEEERVMYCDYWREKLKNKPTIKFPKQLSPAIAAITQGFSFTYLKEAFVATLIVIAGKRSEERVGLVDEGDDDSLDDYELWREIKKQIKLLRNDMDNTGLNPSSPQATFTPRDFSASISPPPLSRPSHYHRPRGDWIQPQPISHSRADASLHDIPLAPISLPHRGGGPGQSSAGRMDRSLEGIPLILDSGNVTEVAGCGKDFTLGL